mmetsp:Transcript_42627/g.129443  ORF Transcript_42627/g.129443 Transcript_42627/m.129443 type:complete len:201 (+) Transcript_42627:177-779(+)
MAASAPLRSARLPGLAGLLLLEGPAAPGQLDPSELVLIRLVLALAPLAAYPSSLLPLPELAVLLPSLVEADGDFLRIGSRRAEEEEEENDDTADAACALSASPRLLSASRAALSAGFFMHAAATTALSYFLISFLYRLLSFSAISLYLLRREGETFLQRRAMTRPRAEKETFPCGGGLFRLPPPLLLLLSAALPSEPLGV